jgi:hypothetical protein
VSASGGRERADARPNVVSAKKEKRASWLDSTGPVERVRVTRAPQHLRRGLLLSEEVPHLAWNAVVDAADDVLYPTAREDLTSDETALPTNGSSLSRAKNR